MKIIEPFLKRLKPSRSLLSFLVLISTSMSAYASCERSIYNKSNVAYTVKCRGCETPWQKTIPANGRATINYTSGWHYATLVFKSAGQRNRYQNPSTFGVWTHKNGTTAKYSLAEYGYAENILEISVGKQAHVGGCHNFYFASYQNSSNAFRRFDKEYIKAPLGNEGYLSLSQPAKMDIAIYANGQHRSCYYLKTLIPAALRGPREKFICSCVDTKTLKRHTPNSADGPCNQPRKISYRSPPHKNPPQQFADPAAAQLNQLLGGTTWSYQTGDDVIRFRFGKDGKIKGHAPWATVRWRATARNKVVLDKATGATSLLVFSSLKAFTGDWWSSGRTSYGKRVSLLTPQAIAAFKQKLTGTFWGLTAGPYHDNFKFGANGYLQRGRWNNRVRWAATGINTVTLYGKTKNLYVPDRTIIMTLHFNGKNFSTRGWSDRGWNGDKLAVANGRRLDARQTTWQPTPPPPTRPTTPAIPTPHTAGPGCNTLDTARSTNGGQGMQLTFVNVAGVGLKLFWIDGAGGKKYYAQIAPNRQYVINTSSRHPWILETLAGDCRAVITPNPTIPRVSIR